MGLLGPPSLWLPTNRHGNVELLYGLPAPAGTVHLRVWARVSPPSSRWILPDACPHIHHPCVPLTCHTKDGRVREEEDSSRQQGMDSRRTRMMEVEFVFPHFGNVGKYLCKRQRGLF